MSTITPLKVYLIEQTKNDRVVYQTVSRETLKEIAERIQKPNPQLHIRSLATRNIKMMDESGEMTDLGSIAQPIPMDFNRFQLRDFGIQLLSPETIELTKLQ